MNDNPEWFAPKRYGYGAGLPISWQGWAVLLVYVGIVVITTNLLRPKPLVVVAIVVPITALLLVITARTTRGRWHWRWGEKD